MSDIGRLTDFLRAEWLEPLHQVHHGEARTDRRRPSIIHFEQTLERLAFKLLTEQRRNGQNLVGALFARDQRANEIIKEHYVNMLRGESPVTSAEPLPSGEIILPTPIGNVLIGPYNTTHGIRDPRAVLLTTPTRASGLPRIAEFTDRAYIQGRSHPFEGVLQIEGLCFECSGFKCKVSFGRTTLGELDLLDAYIRDIKNIQDAPIYLRACDLFVEDYLHRTARAINVVISLLHQDPEIQKPTLFRQALKPLLDVAQMGWKAFYGSDLNETLEGSIVNVHMATFNNSIQLLSGIVDPEHPGLLRPTNVERVIRCLQSLFDLPSHVNQTYRDTPILKDIVIKTSFSNDAPFIVEDPIAVRGIIDQVVYQALRHQGDDPQELTFNFDNTKGEVRILHEKPQSADLKYAVDKAKARLQFRGDVVYHHSRAGIKGLSIKDHKPQSILGGGFGVGHSPFSSQGSSMGSAQALGLAATPSLASAAMLSSATAFCARI